MIGTPAASVSPSRRWTRDYPPLLAIGAGLLIVLAVLPSSLNFPQSNPTQTLEYAPVPPDDNDNPPPAAGNLSSLGLGQSSGIAEAVKPPAPAPVKGISKDASTKHCVGNPPRQTEDPLSPPCVAFFRGDNFGATYSGVKRDEVKVLIVQAGNYTQGGGTSRGTETAPSGYVDLAGPPEEDDFVWTRVLRLYQRYFNERYQTYGRFVHLYIDYATRGASPEARRAGAADNYETIRPFAVSDYFAASQDSYVDAATRYGIVNFLPSGTYTVGGLKAEFFRKHPGLVWGYDPSVEYRAHNFASYVCRKVVPFKASFSGNPGENGKPRKLGLMHTTDEFAPQLHEYARIVKAEVERCGGTFVADRSHPQTCVTDCLYSANPSAYQYAADNMAHFKQEGVSTIIWAGGLETHQSRAAASLDYRPEIVLGGDGLLEATLENQFQDQSVWRNTWAVTTYTKQSPLTEAPCYQAAKEVDPDFPDIDIRNFGCKIYDMLRQLFTGIQVAGPRLGPTTMEEGYRAIPKIASRDPRVPACFYEVGDYTCVKDSVAEWWDPTARDPQSTNPGCMRLAERGKRYLTGGFPKEDVVVRKRSDDPCNVQGLTI